MYRQIKLFEFEEIFHMRTFGLIVAHALFDMLLFRYCFGRL